MRGRLVRTRLSLFLSLAAGLVVLSLSVYGYLLLQQRPGVPPSVPENALVRIGDVDILSVQDRDAALVGKEIGALVDFEVREAGGALRTITAPVVPFFAATAFPLIYLLIGLFCFAIGTATFVLKPADTKARLFYALTLVFGAGLIISGEFYSLHPDRWTTFLPSLLFILAYALVPAVLLTGQKTDEIDKVLGLGLGADDYLLELLVRHEGEVVSRETILNEVWGYETFPTTRTIDTFVHALRRKIEKDPSRPIHLLTVPWMGYKFKK